MKRRILTDMPRLVMLLIGCGIALVLLLFLSIGLGLYSATTADPTAMTDVMGLVALLVSGAIAGFVNCRLFGERGLMIAMLSALLLSLVLLGIGLVCSGGNLPPRCPVNYLCYLGVSLLTALLGRMKTRRRRR